MKIKFCLFLTLILCKSICAQERLLLYADSIPNSTKIELDSTQIPSLEIYQPKEKGSNVGILIIPGGGYQFLAYEQEGTDIAKSFATKGITAFVLRYRLPSSLTMKDRTIGAIQDAQQALRLIKTKAQTWDLDSTKIGTIGFSAGGHLASMLGTKFHHNYIQNAERTSLRPAFMILVYPVISMDDRITHIGSRSNLLGKMPTERQKWLYSSEKQVSFDTPPTYITHSGDDQIVSVENSIEMYKVLNNNKVQSELHLYPKGNHGFVLNLPVAEWMDPILEFLKKQGFYNKNRK